MTQTWTKNWQNWVCVRPLGRPTSILSPHERLRGSGYVLRHLSKTALITVNILTGSSPVLLRLRLLPGIAGHRSRWQTNHTRSHFFFSRHNISVETWFLRHTFFWDKQNVMSQKYVSTKMYVSHFSCLIFYVTTQNIGLKYVYVYLLCLKTCFMSQYFYVSTKKMTQEHKHY